MSKNNTVIVGTVGRDVEVDTKIVLTAYDPGTDPTASLSIIVQRPDGTETTWTAAPKNADYDQTVIVHTLAAGDIDQPGDYNIHSRLVTSTRTDTGALSTIKVLDQYTRGY